MIGICYLLKICLINVIFLFFVVLFKLEKGLFNKIKFGFVLSVCVSVICCVFLFDNVIGYCFIKWLMFKVWINWLMCLDGLVIKVIFL